MLDVASRALDALEGRAVIFDGLGARVGHLLDEMAFVKMEKLLAEYEAMQ